MAKTQTFATFYAEQRFKKEQAVPHYAGLHQFTLETPITDITQYIAKETYLQPIPAKHKTAGGLYKKDPLTPFQLERSTTGAQHAARTALAAELFLELYLKYGNSAVKKQYDDICSKLPGHKKQQQLYFLQLLRITAFYISTDSSRERAAFDCRLLLTTLLTNSNMPSARTEQVAGEFANAILTMRINPLDEIPKPLLSRLLHDANALEAMRKTSTRHLENNLFSRFIFKTKTMHFFINHLESWQDISGDFTLAERQFFAEKHRFDVENILLDLTFTWRDLINDSFDLATNTPLYLAIPKKNKMSVYQLSPGIKNRFDKKKKIPFEKNAVAELQRISDNDDYPSIYHLLHQANLQYKLDFMNELNKDDGYMLLRLCCYNLDSTLRHLTETQLNEQKLTRSSPKAAPIIKIEQNIAAAFVTLCRAITNDGLTHENKLAAIKKFQTDTAPYRDGKDAALFAAFTFIITAATIIVVGSLLCIAVGLALGVITVHPLLVILSGLIGLMASSQTGLFMGLGVIGAALTVSAVSARTNYFKNTHTFFNESLNQVAEFATKTIGDKPRLKN